MFKTERMKWLVVTLVSIMLIAALLLAGCKGATTAPAGGDLQAQLSKANADLAKTQSDLSKAQATITELQAGKAPEAQFKWKMATNYPQTTTTTQVLDLFSDLVENWSKGKIKVDRFYAGALGDANAINDGVRAGTITFGWTYPYSTVNKKFAIAGGVGMPSSWMGLEQLNQLYYNGINYRIMSEAWDEVGDRLILTSHGAPHVIFFVDKQIRTPAELKGVKIRIWDQAIAISALKNMGALPTVIASGEVYNALKTKTVDGYSIIPSTGVSRSVWEVTKYALELPWWTDFYSLAMNKKAYTDLPDDLKKVVDKASLYASIWDANYNLKGEQDAKATLIAKGMTFITLTETEKKAFMDLLKTQELWDTEIKSQIGDKWYPEWKSEVLRLLQTYG